MPLIVYTLFSSFTWLVKILYFKVLLFIICDLSGLYALKSGKELNS